MSLSSAFSDGSCNLVGRTDKESSIEMRPQIKKYKCTLIGADPFLNKSCLKKEIATLREELRAVHRAYISGMKLRDEEQISLTKERDEALQNNKLLTKRNNLQSLNIMAILKKMSHVVKSEELWIGRTLKYQYLFEQMNKIGLRQSEDIFECFQDIEVPEVSVRIKDKFVPTIQTDNTDWESDEESDDWSEGDIIGDWEEEIANSLIEMEDTHGIHAIRIQQMWRGYHTRQLVVREIAIADQEVKRSIVRIQQMWRGYRVRSVYLHFMRF